MDNVGRERYVLSVDAESIGLYGNIFAVGAVVVNEATGAEVEQFYAACPIDDAKDSYRYTWLADNVLPALDSYTCTSRPIVVYEFGKWYEAMMAKYTDLIIVADCGVPVEAFLFRCWVDMDEASRPNADMPQALARQADRQWRAPYPLHEVATAMYMCGLDPKATYVRLPAELPAHHPTRDARQSARQWVECTRKLRDALAHARAAV
jgi:hypothetical protein